MKRSFPFLVIALVLLSGCGALLPSNRATGRATPPLAQTATNAPSPTASPLATQTPPPTPTSIPPTVAPTATTVLIMQGPGDILCPILLYHRVDDLEKTNPYVMPVEDFKDQMELLHQRGYNTITVTQLIKAINFGAPLPERPVVISFDDGDISVYKNAFPIMKELGFVGVGYLVGNYLDVDGYLSVAQVQKLARHGWEFGSHTQSHMDLGQCEGCEYQIVQSRQNLEKALGIKIESFAYPYGNTTTSAVNTVSRTYRGAVGISVLTVQRPSNLFFLWRRPIDHPTSIETFASYLPW